MPGLMSRLWGSFRKPTTESNTDESSAPPARERAVRAEVLMHQPQVSQLDLTSDSPRLDRFTSSVDSQSRLASQLALPLLGTLPQSEHASDLATTLPQLLLTNLPEPIVAQQELPNMSPQFPGTFSTPSRMLHYFSPLEDIANSSQYQDISAMRADTGKELDAEATDSPEAAEPWNESRTSKELDGSTTSAVIKEREHNYEEALFNESQGIDPFKLSDFQRIMLGGNEYNGSTTKQTQTFPFNEANNHANAFPPDYLEKLDIIWGHDLPPLNYSLPEELRNLMNMDEPSALFDDFEMASTDPGPSFYNFGPDGILIDANEEENGRQKMAATPETVPVPPRTPSGNRKRDRTVFEALPRTTEFYEWFEGSDLEVVLTPDFLSDSPRKRRKLVEAYCRQEEKRDGLPRGSYQPTIVMGDEKFCREEERRMGLPRGFCQPATGMENEEIINDSPVTDDKATVRDHDMKHDSEDAVDGADSHLDEHADVDVDDNPSDHGDGNDNDFRIRPTRKRSHKKKLRGPLNALADPLPTSQATPAATSAPAIAPLPHTNVLKRCPACSRSRTRCMPHHPGAVAIKRR